MTVSLQGYTAWLHALIEQINPACPDGSDIHMVGHSFGSIVTAAYAAEYPHGLDRLTLINPISEPALEGSQKIASRAASFYYRVGAALPERLGYPAAAFAADYPCNERADDAHPRTRPCAAYQ